MSPTGLGLPGMPRKDGRQQPCSISQVPKLENLELVLLQLSNIALGNFQVDGASSRVLEKAD